MIDVRLKGGLGNQMFQYALGRVLSIKHNTNLFLDLNYFKNKNFTPREYNLDQFNIKAQIIEKSRIPLLLKFFLPLIKKINWNGNIYLDGYFQSEKYFKEYTEVIRKDFTLKNSPAQNIQILAEEIKKANSVCIHVRRGDYVGNKFHEVVDNEYYNKGIEYINSRTSIEKIYVFSDDIEWCKNNLKFEFPTMFVDSGYAGEKGEGHMYLMSKCKNFIIANSSFSWWGAWLASYPAKIIVAPKQWFPDASINTDDLIPKEWVRI